jgi:hypothetical protein
MDSGAHEKRWEAQRTKFLIPAAGYIQLRYYQQEIIHNEPNKEEPHAATSRALQ